MQRYKVLLYGGGGGGGGDGGDNDVDVVDDDDGGGDGDGDDLDLDIKKIQLDSFILMYIVLLLQDINLLNMQRVMTLTVIWKFLPTRYFFLLQFYIDQCWQINCNVCCHRVPYY